MASLVILACLIVLLAVFLVIRSIFQGLQLYLVLLLRLTGNRQWAARLLVSSISGRPCKKNAWTLVHSTTALMQSIGPAHVIQAVILLAYP